MTTTTEIIRLERDIRYTEIDLSRSPVCRRCHGPISDFSPSGALDGPCCDNCCSQVSSVPWCEAFPLRHARLTGLLAGYRFRLAELRT